jgi:hypothetical protein
MVFKTGQDKNLYVTTDYVKSGVTGAEIKTYMDKLIDVGEYFVVPPVSIVGAELITRSDVDLN